MKLLTLNTHSLIEPAYEAKRDAFVEFIRKEQPDVFALQEVNQTAAAPLLAEAPAGYYPCPGNMVLLKADNHAAAVAKMLEARGVHYDWSWATTFTMMARRCSAVRPSPPPKTCC